MRDGKPPVNQRVIEQKELDAIAVARVVEEAKAQIKRWFTAYTAFAVLALTALGLKGWSELGGVNEKVKSTVDEKVKEKVKEYNFGAQVTESLVKLQVDLMRANDQLLEIKTRSLALEDHQRKLEAEYKGLSESDVARTTAVVGELRTLLAKNRDAETILISLATMDQSLKSISPQLAKAEWDCKCVASQVARLYQLTDYQSRKDPDGISAQSIAKMIQNDFNEQAAQFNAEREEGLVFPAASGTHLSTRPSSTTQP